MYTRTCINTKKVALAHCWPDVSFWSNRRECINFYRKDARTVIATGELGRTPVSGTACKRCVVIQFPWRGFLRGASAFSCCRRTVSFREFRDLSGVRSRLHFRHTHHRLSWSRQFGKSGTSGVLSWKISERARVLSKRFPKLDKSIVAALGFAFGSIRFLALFLSFFLYCIEATEIKRYLRMIYSSINPFTSKLAEWKSTCTFGRNAV